MYVPTCHAQLCVHICMHVYIMHVCIIQCVCDCVYADDARACRVLTAHNYMLIVARYTYIHQRVLSAVRLKL